MGEEDPGEKQKTFIKDDRSSSLFFCSLSCPQTGLVALFKVIWSLLGKGGSEEHLQDSEDYLVHVLDKVTWIHSELDQLFGSFGIDCDMFL